MRITFYRVHPLRLHHHVPLERVVSIRLPARSAVCGLVLFGLAAIVLGTSCAPRNRVEPQVQVEIDPTIQPTRRELAGLDQGPPRPVGVMVGPSGEPVEFVANEIILHPSSDQELQEFIDTYGATILRNGTPMVIPEVEQRGPATSSGWYLLRIDTARSTLDDLDANMTLAGLSGVFSFSSEEAARTLALFARMRDRGIGINPLMYFTASIEHPTGQSTNLDAETFAWFTEDDDAQTPGDQGLSTGVTHAWDWLSYKGILEVPGVYYVPKIAIIDGGFALDETTGVPLDGNLDYNTLSAPLQMDLVDRDGTAGGENLLKCGGSVCPWHGQGSFGIAAAYPKNAYGSAGVAGHFVRPMLVKVDTDMYTLADGIRSAVMNGADVISISISGGCGDFHSVCSIPPDDIYDMMLQSVRFARSFLVPVVASAGNDGDDVAEKDLYPCKTEGVICVGSVDGNKMNVYNFGDPVDIWAPTGMYSTVTPLTASADTDDIGTDELYSFSGTSSSAPFVAGAIGLMKSANPNLSYEQVLETLLATTNASPDARVPRGYVDVYRAVRELLPNQPPTVQITRPSDGQTFGWRAAPTLQVNYSDPEVNPENMYRWHGEVVYTSEQDGELCRSSSPPYTCSARLAELTLGTHAVTATATDAFGETATHQITINVVNRPPQPRIIRPLATDTLHSHIPAQLTAYVPDPDESIPDASVSWSSDVDGPLGTGWQVTHQLTTGTHTLTVTAVDGKGLMAQDQVTVNVTPGEGLPLPQITSPGNNLFIAPGMMVTLQGTASDLEDGTLSGSSLEWRSSIDGLLGTGSSIQVLLSGPQVPCNPEAVDHTISFTARDSDGHEVAVQIVISVGIIC